MIKGANDEKEETSASGLRHRCRLGSRQSYTQRDKWLRIMIEVRRALEFGHWVGDPRDRRRPA